MNDLSQLMTALKKNLRTTSGWKARNCPSWLATVWRMSRTFRFSRDAVLVARAPSIHLYGMEDSSGMYVGEISAGGELNPEKHMYEKVIVIRRITEQPKFGRRTRKSAPSSGVDGACLHRRSIPGTGSSTEDETW
jgi:hypothetical protein